MRYYKKAQAIAKPTSKKMPVHAGLNRLVTFNLFVSYLADLVNIIYLLTGYPVRP